MTTEKRAGIILAYIFYLKAKYDMDTNATIDQIETRMNELITAIDRIDIVKLNDPANATAAVSVVMETLKERKDMLLIMHARGIISEEEIRALDETVLRNHAQHDAARCPFKMDI